MNKENDKLNKFKAEAKLKSKKSDFFNSYLEKTNNIDDKIALIKFKYKDDNEKTTDILKRVIMKKLGNNVKENTDNNNIVLRGVNETLNKLEKKIDEYSGNDEEVEIVPEKDTFHNKFMKDLADNTPHVGQFDEKV